jgi:hypothetical protein
MINRLSKSFAEPNGRHKRPEVKQAQATLNPAEPDLLLDKAAKSLRIHPIAGLAAAFLTGVLVAAVVKRR